MQKLGVVEDTLFVPMLGRIYASEHCPQILYDKKALELKNKLPSDLIEQNMQNQYTLLASASRSANMDRIIRDFLERRPNGAIVQLGCGLETTYYRCDNGRARWYAVDLPHVLLLHHCHAFSVHGIKNNFHISKLSNHTQKGNDLIFLKIME